MFSTQNARAAFVKQLQELLATPVQSRPALPERIQEKKMALDGLFTYLGQDGTEQLLAVGNVLPEEVRDVTDNQWATTVITQENMELLQRLAALGVITFNQNNLKAIY